MKTALTSKKLLNLKEALAEFIGSPFSNFCMFLNLISNEDMTEEEKEYEATINSIINEGWAKEYLSSDCVDSKLNFYFTVGKGQIFNVYLLEGGTAQKIRINFLDWLISQMQEIELTEKQKAF